MNRTRRTAGSAFLLIAALVLLVAAFVGWYSVTISASQPTAGPPRTASGTYTFYPGTSIRDTNSCASGNCTGFSGSSSTTYASQGLNQTGAWYGGVKYACLGGFIVGVVAAVLGFTVRGKGRTATAVVFLATVALVAGLATPLLLYAEQPAAVSADAGASSAARGGFFVGGANGSGPGSSFVGSCSGTDCSFAGGIAGASASWGPSLGWYLALVAVVLFLIGLLLFVRGRGDSPVA